MRARTICVFGTGSDVGKSVVATALCRALSNRGHNVAPFKAQNMSNNSAVTLGGGEIGRAQFVQACAARVVADVDMNPVLLKPASDQSAQVVLLGQVLGTRTAREYFTEPSTLGEQALTALRRLATRHDTLVVEGAGSCAEVNLRARDFVNFRVAHAAEASVLLVADIDRGGVFGQIVGTLEVLPAEDRRRVRGLLINRFRGDRSLFDEGVRYLEQRTGLPVLGVLPFRYDLRLEAEDGLNLDALLDPPEGTDADAKVRIGVIRLPHISNFTDFDALAHREDVALHFLTRPRRFHDYDLLVLPGSKSVRDDLQWLCSSGWAPVFAERARRGRAVLGVCGGFQMLGQQIADPLGLEGTPGVSNGLGLLPVNTVLEAKKVVRRALGQCDLWGCALGGYEVHMGVTTGRVEPLVTRFFRDGDEQPGVDGAVSGAVLGTYLHGLFEGAEAVDGLLRWLKPGVDFLPADAGASREAQINLLAEHFEAHVDVARLLSWLESPFLPVQP